MDLMGWSWAVGLAVSSPRCAQVTEERPGGSRGTEISSVPGATQATVSRRVEMQFNQTGCLREGPCSQCSN